jgi:Fic family protein
MEAHKALASLNGTAKHLPNPTLILRPLETREAVRSSSLEGTYTDPQQQALFELEPTYPESRDDPANSQREVFNYATALRLRKDRREELPVSLRLIRQLHEVLMEGVRGSDHSPGSFRTGQNQIGRPPRFVPPPANRLTPLLDDFEKYLHARKTYDPLVDAFIVHYQFEAIHPFMDGNGRVGRLLLAILIQEWCNLSEQWLYMSAYFDANKDRYMDHLLRISTHGAWEEWIEFCLTGVVVQAQDTQRRCERLLDLHLDFHERLREVGGSVRLAAIVDDLFKTPVVRVSRVAARHEVTYPTSRADLQKLERAGIITRLTRTTKISYYCEPIFEVIYSD